MSEQEKFGLKELFEQLKTGFEGLTGVRSSEMASTLLSFSFIFLLMFAYNILKPVRDALAPEWTDVELASLWTINFAFSAIAVAIYGVIVSKFKLKNVVPGVYAFFAASFVAFYIAAKSTSDSNLVNQAFYVWISLFSLFHVSVFWSLMADLFTRKQAPRLFAFISSGASIGIIAGSAATLFLAQRIGTLNLMLLSAAMLVLAVPLIALLRNSIAEETGKPESPAPVQGNPFGGFVNFVSNPYLFGIGVFIFLYTFIGSFAYFELKNLFAGNDRDTVTAMWAGINLAVNSITIVTAMFATSRIAARFGVGKTLAFVPLLVAVALVVVFFNPVLAVMVVGWVVLKAGNYGITRPAREMLYTLVSREDRFKTKQVIDIVVYRGGDTFAGWVFALLSTTLALGMGAIAIIGAVVAIGWAFVGLRLGDKYDAAKDAAEDVTV